MNALTDRQRAVLDFIRATISAKGYPPTLREIGTHFGIKSTNGVRDHVNCLERKGYIARSDMKSRGIRLTAAAPLPLPIEEKEGDEARAELIQVPVLARIRAGRPLVSEGEILTTYTLPAEEIPGEGMLFALRVQGHAMAGEGIVPGDDIIFPGTDERSPERGPLRGLARGGGHRPPGVPRRELRALRLGQPHDADHHHARGRLLWSDGAWGGRAALAVHHPGSTVCMIDFAQLGLDVSWCEVLGREGHLVCVVDNPAFKPWTYLLISPDGVFFARDGMDGEFKPALHMPNVDGELSAGIAILVHDWVTSLRADHPEETFVIHPGLAELLPGLPTDPENSL